MQPDIITIEQTDIQLLATIEESVVVIDEDNVYVVTVNEPVAVVVDQVESTIVVLGEQGLPGRDGLSGTLNAINFAYGDASPVPIFELTADKMLYAARVFVTEPFDGDGASVALGTDDDPDFFLSPADTDLSIPASYEMSLGVKFGADTPINITIIPGAGASAGRGQVVFEIEV